MSSQLMYRRAAEELRAAAFHRTCTLRRVLSALAAYATGEKLRQWEHQEVAEKHSRRSASITVTLTVTGISAQLDRQAPPLYQSRRQ